MERAGKGAHRSLCRRCWSNRPSRCHLGSLLAVLDVWVGVISCCSLFQLARPSFRTDNSETDSSLWRNEAFAMWRGAGAL